MMKKPILVLLLATGLMAMDPAKKHTMLCLGDSYTIGESVHENERFPMQAVQLLKGKGLDFDKPVIIAKTGWTTDELQKGITDAHVSQKFDYVTLLIGVNNEYRGRDAEEYRKQFDELLNTAIDYANGKRSHVFVISIPDWGATPFAANDPRQRSRDVIAQEINHFNAINHEEAVKAKVNYVDIGPIARRAIREPDLTAEDNLHPSGKMYAGWAKLLADAIARVK
ncbi:MAG TPA: SGNH/GDSL hydrolase family protein [Chitinophagales bacterium]|nr:SGNH/GDSL hydrolase family protein [Chitinophagales bacterium]